MKRQLKRLYRALFANRTCRKFNSQELVRVFPNSRVVSIEPHPQSYARLCDCLRHQVQPLQLALGSVCGEATLFDRDDCQGSEHASLQKEAITEHHKQGAHEVNVKIDKLDAVADRLGIESIDLLKVDTEGHEFDVLKGAESLLRRNAIRVIQLEFNAMNVYRRVFLRDRRKMLPHYRFYRLLPKSMIEVPEDPLRSELFGFQNVVCIHEDLAQQAAA